MIDIREIKQKQIKQTICREILNALPSWFGIPQAVDKYIEKTTDMPFWGAYLNNQCVGFIAIKNTSAVTAEIYVMGVLRKFHHQGIGKRLFETAYIWCQQNNYEFLQVKTLDETHPDKFYQRTRLFYLSLGFKKLESFDNLWGKDNPCLVLIMSIK